MYYVISACPENCYKISFFTKSLVGRGSGSRPSLSPAGFRPKAWLQKISSPSSRKPSLSRGIQAEPGRNITSCIVSWPNYYNQFTNSCMAYDGLWKSENQTIYLQLTMNTYQHGINS